MPDARATIWYPAFQGLLIPVILFALATFVIAGVGLGTDPQTTWLPAIVQPGTGNEW